MSLRCLLVFSLLLALYGTEAESNQVNRTTATQSHIPVDNDSPSEEDPTGKRKPISRIECLRRCGIHLINLAFCRCFRGHIQYEDFAEEGYGSLTKPAYQSMRTVYENEWGNEHSASDTNDYEVLSQSSSATSDQSSDSSGYDGSSSREPSRDSVVETNDIKPSETLHALASDDDQYDIISPDQVVMSDESSDEDIGGVKVDYVSLNNSDSDSSYVAITDDDFV